MNDVIIIASFAALVVALGARALYLETRLIRLRGEFLIQQAVINNLRFWLREGAEIRAVDPAGKILENDDGVVVFGGLHIEGHLNMEDIANEIRAVGGVRGSR